MPIYEYRCTKCESEFEYMQRMSDAPRTTCESCGATLERLISRSSFALKGAGWYKDLYSSAKSSAKSDGGGGASGESKASSGGGEAKSSSGGGESKGSSGGGESKGSSGATGGGSAKSSGGT
jgi:putative FmdB family regulatory protein